MVGEGVLHECLQRDEISGILVVGRRSCGKSHPKLKEVILPDFYDLSKIAQDLAGFDACFFCLGVSSIGVNEAEYTKLTHTLTLIFAEAFLAKNPTSTFCYISGAGTDSTEKGRSMWARVKGKTENDLVKLPFKGVYNFRPAVIIPTKGLNNTLAAYKYLGWLIPLIKFVAPGYIIHLKELGQAMINVVLYGFDKNVLEVRDIKAISRIAGRKTIIAQNKD